MNPSALRAPRRHGFTVVELVIVIATFAVLTAVVSPTFVELARKTRFDPVVEEMRTMENALVRYYTDTGSLKPLENIAGITDSVQDPAHKHLISGDGREG
jgi:prepilin-type N-terminal cleavage/methylation domain-containing protein